MIEASSINTLAVIGLINIAEPLSHIWESARQNGLWYCALLISLDFC